jgi:hypothetical protein
MSRFLFDSTFAVLIILALKILETPNAMLKNNYENKNAVYISVYLSLNI